MPLRIVMGGLVSVCTAEAVRLDDGYTLASWMGVLSRTGLRGSRCLENQKSHK